MSCGLMPSPTESDPWGSKSTSSTRRPYSASAAPRLIVVVVLPTPPFWLHIAMIRAGPCRCTGAGSGRRGTGRPVGPTSRASRALLRLIIDMVTGRSIYISAKRRLDISPRTQADESATLLLDGGGRKGFDERAGRVPDRAAGPGQRAR